MMRLWTPTTSAMREQGPITTPTKMPSEASKATNPNVSRVFVTLWVKSPTFTFCSLRALFDKPAGPVRGARDDDNVRSQSETQNCPTRKGKPFRKYKNNLHTHLSKESYGAHTPSSLLRSTNNVGTNICHRRAADQAENFGAAKRAQMANIEQMKKIIPFITREI